MDPETAVLLSRAAALRRAGQIEEAIVAYEELLAREPALPNSWYNLGWLQRRARRYEQALASYAEALNLGIGEPEEVHLNRAVILSDFLARPDEAQAELQAALRLKPDYLPALLNLGNLHEDRGDRAAAETVYRKALEVDPRNALALSRVAGLVDGKSDASAQLAQQLSNQLPVAGSAGERADLGFALGRLLDARGDYEQAFAAYAAANRASRESFGPRFKGYDRAAHERFVDRLIATFPEPVQPGAEPAPSAFICGMFRSGSTLVEQILGGHSRVSAGGELDLVPALVAAIPNYPEGAASAGDAERKKWRDFYRKGLRPLLRDGALVTDKRPDNFLHIGFIKTLFPAAKIVHTKRDRTDNLLSLYFLHLDPGMAYALDLSDAAHWYGEYERLMAHWKTLYPEEIFDVDYDALVRDPKPQLERLVDFLGLDWEDGLLDFHSRSGAVKTASVWQVREPLHARSSGRWRNYSKQLESALGASGR